jgi:hypothetical protein
VGRPLPLFNVIDGDGFLLALLVGKQLHRGKFVHRDAFLGLRVAFSFRPELLCQVVAVKAPFVCVLIFVLFRQEFSDWLDKLEVPDCELRVSLRRIRENVPLAG